MKITVELSENDMRDIIKYSGERKKGPAIKKFVVTGLMLKRRAELSEKFRAGEWSASLPSTRELRKDRSL